MYKFWGSRYITQHRFHLHLLHFYLPWSGWSSTLITYCNVYNVSHMRRTIFFCNFFCALDIYLRNKKEYYILIDQLLNLKTLVKYLEEEIKNARISKPNNHIRYQRLHNRNYNDTNDIETFLSYYDNRQITWNENDENRKRTVNMGMVRIELATIIILAWYEYEVKHMNCVTLCYYIGLW